MPGFLKKQNTILNQLFEVKELKLEDSSSNSDEEESEEDAINAGAVSLEPPLERQSQEFVDLSSSSFFETLFDSLLSMHL